MSSSCDSELRRDNYLETELRMRWGIIGMLSKIKRQWVNQILWIVQAMIWYVNSSGWRRNNELSLLKFSGSESEKISGRKEAMDWEFAVGEIYEVKAWDQIVSLEGQRNKKWSDVSSVGTTEGQKRQEGEGWVMGIGQWSIDLVGSLLCKARYLIVRALRGISSCQNWYHLEDASIKEGGAV